MYLKSLTALGFKSFADKTTLNFMPGVSAIVGPNGCGKSNISDAIRWVLGEQSAKALRGGEMADVIFNGTDGRKPLSMAEVSLTLGDVDEEHLKAAGVEMAFNEITVTRRVFRDGGSEYFINKTPCRLKDIQQLFMGTGMGRTSYSIMAQGNITQIISSKPEDRRNVFEEAAGITKFKAQKKEALRKLEHTDQNLLRLQDLIKEVKRQIGSLQRQAGKARRYKALMAELQRLDTQLARHQFDVLQSDISAKQTELERLQLEAEISTESVGRTENELAALRQKLAEIEQKISQTQQRGHELKNQSDRHESRIHFNQERLNELEKQNHQALAEIAQSEERKTAGEQELAHVKEQLAAAQTALQEHRNALEEKKNAVQAVERELLQQQETVRRTQNELFNVAQQLSRTRNEINALDLQKQGNIVRIEKLTSEKVQLEEERTRSQARLQEFATAVEQQKATIQSSRGTVQERQTRLRQIHDELAVAGQKLDGLLRQQAEKRSRLNLLEQLQNDYEGFSSSVVAVLKGAKDVLGSLTDHIRVPNEHITAIETALGAHLQLALTKEPEAAHSILNELNSQRRGRASIASLSMVELAERNNGLPDPATPEGTVPALSVVETDDSVRPLLRKLIGKTFIAPDLATATNVWRNAAGSFSVVTRNGEFLSREGIYSGGATQNGGKQSTSILARKNQISDLKGELEQLTEQITEASKAKGALQSEQTAVQASLQQAQTELRTQEVSIASREGEFRVLQSAGKALEQKLQTVSFELQSLSKHDEEGMRRREGLASQIAQLEGRESGAQQQVAELNTAIEALRQRRDAAHATLTETKVGLASDEQVCASLRHQQNALESRIRDLSNLLQRRKGEIDSILQKKAQFEAEIGESRQQIAGLQDEREAVNTQLTSLVSEKQTEEVQMISKDEELKNHRRRLTELQHSKGALDVEVAQKRMTVDNLRQRIREKYQLTLDDIRSECITITIATEGQPQIETLTPEEMQARGLSTDWTAIAEQVTALQEKIEQIGAVNLVAIEEYEETETRFNFLSSQHDDLVKAKEQLLDVIGKINSQTREMFTETFYKVRENFRTLFTEIFGGGKADLVLVNEGDVLESGIDIVARPPGKPLQSISLLSGGEQTMTAVALLFAIYQVKPSPFCVLDELDAPLDESNINRFIKVLQRFLSHSQFVIITHNKRTIAMADVLYGVTMEEHGVSKIVSVKFHKASETQSGHPPGNGATPVENGQPSETRTDNVEVATTA
ncbi:MAG TPA: chromosome segregation protein SMC [Methylomirabilota bacterium]|nr:chromosome segregation protein SMC [Methylomirabilota bacterium]